MPLSERQGACYAQDERFLWKNGEMRFSTVKFSDQASGKKRSLPWVELTQAGFDGGGLTRLLLRSAAMRGLGSFGRWRGG